MQCLTDFVEVGDLTAFSIEEVCDIRPQHFFRLAGNSIHICECNTATRHCTQLLRLLDMQIINGHEGFHLE